MTSLAFLYAAYTDIIILVIYLFRMHHFLGIYYLAEKA